MKALWPYSFINGIFNYENCNVPNWSQDITNPEIIKDIILTIKTRGPYAIINKNEGEFKKIKLIQELYDICEEKYENLFQTIDQ